MIPLLLCSLGWLNAEPPLHKVQQEQITLELRGILPQNEFPTLTLADNLQLCISLHPWKGETLQVELATPGPNWRLLRQRKAEILKSGSQQTWQQVFELEALNLGQLDIPEVLVRLQTTPKAEDKEIRFPRLRVMILDPVRSGVSELRDGLSIEPLAGPDDSSSTLLLLAATTGLCMIVAFVVYRRRRRTISPQPRSPKDVASKALEQLELAWRSSKLPRTQFPVELSHIVRGFLEAELGFPVNRQTTEEFFAALRGDTSLNEQGQSLLQLLLDQIDQAKYAGTWDQESSEEEMLRQAHLIIAEVQRPERIGSSHGGSGH